MAFHSPHCSALLLHDCINPCKAMIQELLSWYLASVASCLSWCSATSHLSEMFQKHLFITCLDLLQIRSPFSALVRRSSDHLLSCCCFFSSMPISRSLNILEAQSRHTPFSSQNLLPRIALGFHPLPRCASQLILMSTLSCLHIFSKLFDSFSIILYLPPQVEAAASCSNLSLPN